MVQELPTQWRVYQKEWVQAGKFADDEAALSGAEVYKERLEEEDVAIQDAEVGDRSVLWIRFWNVKGEFKHESDARGYGKVLPESVGPIEVVERNTRAEHTLRAYGKLKLRRT